MSAVWLGNSRRAGPHDDPVLRSSVTSWLRRHHQGRVSGHRYALEEFALDRAAVDLRFARYLDWAGQRGLVDAP